MAPPEGTSPGTRHPLTVMLSKEAFEALDFLCEGGTFDSVDHAVEQALVLLDTHMKAFTDYVIEQHALGRDPDVVVRKMRPVVQFVEDHRSS